MTNQLIHFVDMAWETPKEGVQQKIYSDGKNRMRLLRFSDTFREDDWCENGHIGLVLEGEMTIDFNGVIKHYKKGDGLWIEKGELHKHKAIIEKGKFIELILFEFES